jgi:hypothetical protein
LLWKMQPRLHWGRSVRACGLFTSFCLWS